MPKRPVKEDAQVKLQGSEGVVYVIDEHFSLVQEVKPDKKGTSGFDDFNFFLNDVAIYNRNGYIDCSKRGLSIVSKSEGNWAEPRFEFGAGEATMRFRLGETNDSLLSTGV